jgi:hypothetical protein
MGQPVAQRVEELPQVGVRLGLGGLRPEEEGELLARLRGAAMQEDIGEQGLQASGEHTGQLRIRQREAEMTQQSNVQF